MLQLPRSRRVPQRRGAALAVLGVAAALLVVTGQPAAAHDRLQATTPADGSVVETAPATVVLTFDQPAIALGSRVVVLSADGSTVSAGAPRLVDDDVTQDLAGDLPAGEYQVEWRITSADGHPVSGEFSFTASAPGQGAVAAPTATATATATLTATTDGGASPQAGPAPASAGPLAGSLLLGGAGALVVVAVVVLAVTRRRRRSRQRAGCGHGDGGT